MTDEGSFESHEEITPNHPLLIAQRSNFQWAAALNASALVAGWQDHLTRYMVASATTSVSFEGQEPLRLLDVKVLDDPLHLYQIIIHEQAADVQVSYRSLSQTFMDQPYDCHLLLKTEVGGRFVTLPAPKPPGQAEWKQVLKKLWFQLLLSEDALLVISDTPHAAQGQPLYTFKLHSELSWEEADLSPSGGVTSEWQRELRLVLDPAEPGVLRAQVGWNDSQLFSNPSLEVVSVTRPEQTTRRGSQAKERRVSRPRDQGRVTLPLPAFPSPKHRHWWGGQRVRMAALIAAVLLLILIGAVAVGATRGTPQASNSLSFSNQSPTIGLTPSSVPSATPIGTTATPIETPVPTAQPGPGGPAHPPGSKPTPTPTPKPTPTPTPTATPTPTPTPSPTDTPTPTPSPTDTPTPTPSPTDTPPPTPTDTPTS